MSDERISFIELVDIIVKPRAKPVAAPRPERSQPYEDLVSDDDDEVLHSGEPDTLTPRPDNEPGEEPADRRPRRSRRGGRSDNRGRSDTEGTKTHAQGGRADAEEGKGRGRSRSRRRSRSGGRPSEQKHARQGAQQGSGQQKRSGQPNSNAGKQESGGVQGERRRRRRRPRKPRANRGEGGETQGGPKQS